MENVFFSLLITRLRWNLLLPQFIQWFFLRNLGDSCKTCKKTELRVLYSGSRKHNMGQNISLHLQKSIRAFYGAQTPTHIRYHEIYWILQRSFEYYNFRPCFTTHFTFCNSTSSQTGYSMRKEKKNEGWGFIFFPIGNWLVHEKWSVWQMVGCKRLKIKRPSMMSAEKKSGFRGHCEKHLFSLYYCTQPSPRRPGTCLRKVNSFYSMQLKYWNGPVMCNWLIFQNVIQSVRCFQLSVILNL